MQNAQTDIGPCKCYASNISYLPIYYKCRSDLVSDNMSGQTEIGSQTGRSFQKCIM